MDVLTDEAHGHICQEAASALWGSRRDAFASPFAAYLWLFVPQTPQNSPDRRTGSDILFGISMM